MKKIIFILIFTLSFQTYADDYKTAQRFAAGDVVSADVLNDILDRIELILKPIVVSDLVGTWDVKQYICKDGQFGATDFCDNGEDITTTGIEGEVFPTRTDTLTIADNGDGTFSWTSSAYQLLYNANYQSVMAFNTGNLTHNCFILPAQILGCKLSTTNNLNGNRTIAYMNIKRTSDSQIVAYWGPRSGGYNFNHLIMNKKTQPPVAPTSLAATVSSGSIALTWTAGDATEDSYDVQRKSSATGTYTSIGLPTTESYTDTTGVATTTYWYRVFAKNTNGTSIGSNVISVVAQ
tara:strand:+ start:354 stop:1229 length:876 start_codon:yes stop_codon:yes gene_type:complete